MIVHAIFTICQQCCLCDIWQNHIGLSTESFHCLNKDLIKSCVEFSIVCHRWINNLFSILCEQSIHQCNNIVYLTHGWWGTADSLAEGVAPVVDQLTSAGSIAPTIVVFATYYPDRSFATEDYEDDYALNRFFATTEIDTLIKTVESHYTTFARGDTSDESLRASRRHRAFGGFSMGATTTWDVFALRPQYFYGYIPMAGESWIGREEDADSAQIAQLVTAGAERAHYGPQDFRIFASVGSLDPALGDMSPQLAQMRADYPDLMTDDSLQMWIDEGESHSMASVGNQVAHDLPLLFPPA